MRRSHLVEVVHSDGAIEALRCAPPSFLSPDEMGLAIEQWLDRLLPAADAHPQTLHRAMRHAVFSGGKRLRPQLLLTAVQACGQPQGELALRTACAVELVHAASLVHDDLPCFDDAAERRGRPTVHVAFGEAMAVLVGDALLSLAFTVVSDVSPELAPRALRVVQLLSRMTGSAAGIIGGQSLEQNAQDALRCAVPLSPELIERYHQMKTGALFRLATEAAALLSGHPDTVEWAGVGHFIGLLYQLADDWIDVHGQAAAAGKPTGQDAKLGRPNAVAARGAAAVAAQMRALCRELRARVLCVALAPRPLLAFLDALCAQLQRALGIPLGQPDR